MVNSKCRNQPCILKFRALCVKCPKPGKCEGKKCNSQLDSTKKKCGCSGSLSTPGCPAKQFKWKGCKSDKEKKDCSTKSKNAKIKKP